MTQQLAKADYSRTIELQCDNGCATGWRDPDDFGKILTPREVVLPALLAWMVKRRICTIDGIRSGIAVELVAVAAGAGQCQVVNCGPTAAA